MKIINTAISFLNRHTPLNSNKELHEQAHALAEGLKQARDNVHLADKQLEQIMDEIVKAISERRRSNGRDDGL